MDRLKSFTERTREEFDYFSPSEGHFDRFKARLKILDYKNESRFFAYKIAAGVAVAVALFAVSFLYLSDSRQDEFYSLFDPDIKEAVYYYNSLSNEMENKIVESEFGSDNDKRIVLEDIKQYDRDFKLLLRDARSYPNDERIKNALIEHLRGKTEFLEIIIEQIEINQI